MFKFNYKERFPVSGKKFLERTMYNFDEYVKFAPNLERVEVLSRETLPDGREKTAIRVFAKAAFPEAVRAVMKIDSMDWKEEYTIDWNKLTVDWNVEAPVFTEYVECGGTSNVKDIVGGCEMSVAGTMKIETPPMKGIPDPVVRTFVGIIEPFIGRLVSLNLKKYFKSIREAMEKER